MMNPVNYRSVFPTTHVVRGKVKSSHVQVEAGVGYVLSWSYRREGGGGVYPDQVTLLPG